MYVVAVYLLTVDFPCHLYGFSGSPRSHATVGISPQNNFYAGTHVCVCERLMSDNMYCAQCG